MKREPNPLISILRGPCDFCGREHTADERKQLVDLLLGQQRAARLDTLRLRRMLLARARGWKPKVRGTLLSFPNDFNRGGQH